MSEKLSPRDVENIVDAHTKICCIHNLHEDVEDEWNEAYAALGELIDAIAENQAVDPEEIALDGAAALPGVKVQTHDDGRDTDD